MKSSTFLVAVLSEVYSTPSSAFVIPKNHVAQLSYIVGVLHSKTFCISVPI